jgi:hypothetical protein
MLLRPTSLCVATVAALALAGPASAQVDFEYKGYVETDLRFSVPGKDMPGLDDEIRFIRNENTARVTAGIGWGSGKAVGDLSVVFTGIDEVSVLGDLTNRQKVDPFRIESEALYIDVYDFIVPGVDLRIGRQIVKWGTADQFNPTNNLNAYDLEDPLKFGENVPNEMILLRYLFPISIWGEDTPILDEVSLTFAVVPYFRPGLIPESGNLGFTEPSLFGQLVDSPTLHALLRVQEVFSAQGGGLTYDVQVDSPELTLDNMQYGAKLRWILGGIELSVSYYNGFSTIPRAEVITAENLPFDVDLDDIDGLLDVVRSFDFSGVVIDTGVQLTYPRVHVIGADFATSLDFLGGVGLWGEFTWTLHDKLYRLVQIGNNLVLELDEDAGGFWKLATGVDYSITSWWYMNVQYLHGFVDEFGKNDLDDYLVAGTDFKLFNELLLIRGFVLLNFQDLSTTLYPQITARFWQNTELTVGAFLYTGAYDSKFGTPITGPNTVFLRGKYSF